MFLERMNRVDFARLNFASQTTHATSARVLQRSLEQLIQSLASACCSKVTQISNLLAHDFAVP